MNDNRFIHFYVDFLLKGDTEMLLFVSHYFLLKYLNKLFGLDLSKKIKVFCLTNIKSQLSKQKKLKNKNTMRDQNLCSIQLKCHFT